MTEPVFSKDHNVYGIDEDEIQTVKTQVRLSRSIFF